MSALANAQNLKQEMIEYRDELLYRVKDFPKLRLELYRKMFNSIQRAVANIEWKVINVAGQYMILPFIDVGISNYPFLRYTGAVQHLEPPISGTEADVILPDPLEFDIDKIRAVKDISTQMVVSTLLYREVPVNEGGDVCNTRACYLFASIKKDSWYDSSEDPRIICTSEYGCKPTVLFAGNKGIAIYELDKWINGKQMIEYISESKRFGALVYSGRAKFVAAYKEPSDLQCKESFISNATFILPLYCDPETETCSYPRCEYSESCTDGYLNDVEFMGVKLPIDTYVAIVKLADAQLIPFAVAMGGVYQDIDNIKNVYIESGVRFIPAEIYSTIKPVIREYPIYHVVPPPME